MKDAARSEMHKAPQPSVCREDLTTQMGHRKMS
jgi:hypothetical protein